MEVDETRAIQKNGTIFTAKYLHCFSHQPKRHSMSIAIA